MLEVERGIIDREEAIGIDVAAPATKLDAALAENGPTLAAAEARWEAEKELVAPILELRARLRGEGVALDAAAEAPAAAEPAMAEAGDAGRRRRRRAAAAARTATRTSPSCAG